MQNISQIPGDDASKRQLSVQGEKKTLALRGRLFERRSFDMCAFGKDQILAWSGGAMAVVGSDGAVRKTLGVENVKEIKSVHVTSDSSCIALGDTSRVYLVDVASGRPRDVTTSQSGVAEGTFTPIEGGAAWASEKQSVVWIRNGESVKTKLPRRGRAKNERVTAIAEVGDGCLAVGTSSGRVAVFHPDGKLRSCTQLKSGGKDQTITRLAGDARGHIAAEMIQGVFVIDGLDQSVKAPTLQRRVSLAASKACFHENKLLLRGVAPYSRSDASLQILNIETGEVQKLVEEQFWKESFAHFTVDGKVVGGSQSVHHPTRVWDAKTGEILAESSAVQASAQMCQAIAGRVLCRSHEKELGLVDVADGRILLFRKADRVPITSFLYLPNNTVVAAGREGEFYSVEID